MNVITTSTRYSDILKVIIPQNQRFFKKWYIITHPNDQDTINVVKDFNYPNIELVLFNFYENGKIFNKGGAIRSIQKIIPSGTPVLLLDSDIYLPDNFLNVIPTIENDKLYSSDKRYYFYTRKALLENIWPRY